MPRHHRNRLCRFQTSDTCLARRFGHVPLDLLRALQRCCSNPGRSAVAPSHSRILTGSLRSSGTDSARSLTSRTVVADLFRPKSHPSLEQERITAAGEILGKSQCRRTSFKQNMSSYIFVARFFDSHDSHEETWPSKNAPLLLVDETNLTHDKK